ncbi:MAG: type IX secretion system membrane protein PorP/SprF [Bacteroidales bacterium]|nr:type IX secretion system membrane protein PorP/SprF [Bacteroidales bacterium]
MKKVFQVFCLLTIITNLNAQQERQVSQFMFDHISINPGYAGSYDMITACAILRQQWFGFGDGTPQDIILNLDAPFRLFKKNHGVGLSVFRDKVGYNEDINLSLSYAFQANVGDGKLGIGIGGGFLNRKLVDPVWNYGSGPEHNPNDPSVPTGKQNEFIIDMNVGFFYKTDELYVGISSTHLLEDEFIYESETTSSISNDQMVRHYYLTAGYDLQLSNPAFEFMPSILVESDGATTRIDLNATFRYNKKIWVGVSYRVGAAVVGMAGLEILNGVKIGYAYDFETSDLMNFQKGSHEIMVSYAFKVGVEKASQKYKSIRFL